MEKFETITLLGKELDVYGGVEEPWFKAVDVAKIIDYSIGNTSTMLETVDDYEKGRKIVKTLGGPQTVWMLTEGGLYEVLMQSRKPIARQFKRGVKKILREIRMGTYKPPFTKPQSVGKLYEHCVTFGDLMAAYEDRCAEEEEMFT